MPPKDVTEKVQAPTEPAPFDLTDLHLWAEIKGISEEINHNIAEHEQGFEVPEGSTRHAYQRALHTVIQPVRAGVQAELDSRIKALDDGDEELNRIQQELEDLYSTLQARYDAVSAVYHHMNSTHEELSSIRIVEAHVGKFLDYLHVPSDVVTNIRTAQVHSDEFRGALACIAMKAAFFSSDQNASGAAGEEGTNLVYSLMKIASNRVQERLERSLVLLKEPSSNLQILRNTLLLQQRHLITFVRDCDHAFFDKVCREYVELASRAIVSEFSSYCSMVLSGVGGSENGQPSFDLSSLARGTSDMFSAIFSETLSAATSALDANGERIDEAEPTEMAQRLLELVSRPSVSTAELVLRDKTDILPLYESFHHCTAHFFEAVEMEEEFLTNTFGHKTADMLNEVFMDASVTLLGVLQHAIEGYEATRPSLLQFLLPLFVSRAHRRNISVSRGVDFRITFLVNAERLLLTAFVGQFNEKKHRSRKEIPGLPTEPDAGNESYVQWVISVSDFIPDIHVAAAMCSTGIEAEDLMDMVEKRLQLFCKELTELLSEDLLASNETDCALRMRLLCLATFLNVLRKPNLSDFSRGICESMAVQPKKAFDTMLLTFTGRVVSRFAPEVMIVEDVSGSEPSAAFKKQLDSFREHFEQKLNSIAMEFQFLRRPGIDISYYKTAKKTAFSILASRNDKLTHFVRKSSPQDLHLVVPQAALSHAMAMSE